jgi:hypothetical protein
MTKQQKTLRAAEELVRAVLSKDSNQKVSKSTVRNVAAKVSKTIPDLESKRRVAA